MTSLEERRFFSYPVKLRSDADIREVIAWCRANIQPRLGILVSARLWSAETRNSCKVTGQCWCSIRQQDNDELAQYMTFESLKLYGRNNRSAEFAFNTRADSLLFDMRWR